MTHSPRSASQGITRVLVANRGEIASRVFRTCRRLGIETVAVHADADADLPYVRAADYAVRLPGSTPAETYLRPDLLVAAARTAGADALHPGYGFLSENASFARAVVDAGLIWVGPAPDSIERMGSKIGAKEIMRAAGVPVLEADLARPEAPLLIKASAGGGGRGMRIVRDLATLDAEMSAARAEAASAFGDDTVFVEPYVERGRHVEVQLVGTTVVGDRDCSIQRRHQKVVEEAPAPGLPDDVRAALHAAARAAAEAIGYVGAGTVEFLYEESTGRFWFLEMNTRLQVEHPVTEEVFGVDLVEWQLAVADPALQPSGGMPTPTSPEGHAIEVRLYAEDPAAAYQPQAGVLSRVEFGDEVRVEATYEAGSTVTTYYDPMIAKVIAHGRTRAQAARTLAAALRRARLHGLRTNRAQLVEILTSPAFLAGEVSTAFLDDLLTDRGSSDACAPHRPQEHQSVSVAAAIALAERTRRPGVPVAWRNVTSQPQRTTFTVDGAETTVEWYGTRTGYRIDGVTVIAASPAAITLEVDGLRTTYEVTISGPPGAEHVDVDGPRGHTSLRRVPRFVDPATQVAAGSLLAPMPGSVVAVHAAAGERVAAGQPLLVVEAMKMQHTIVAPRAGVLAEIAEAGRQVEAGAVLAVIEDGPDAGPCSTHPTSQEEQQ